MTPSPNQASRPRAEELGDLRLMRQMLAEALGVSPATPISQITAKARTCIFLCEAEAALDLAKIERMRAPAA